MVLAMAHYSSETTTSRQADIGLISSLSTNPQMCTLAHHLHWTKGLKPSRIFFANLGDDEQCASQHRR